MLPHIDANGVPIDCLSFTVRLAWGYFKRISRSVTRQTYRIPSWAIVTDMLAAIVGVDRGSYYDVSGADNSAIMITPLSDPRTVNIPMTGLGTDPRQDATETAGNWRTYKLIYQNATGGQQLHSYEVLADPAYRIDATLENGEFCDSLREHLVSGTSVYPSSLGKSEYSVVIEDIEVDREPKVQDVDETFDIDSVVPISLSEAVPQGKVTYGVERSPVVMVHESRGHRTTRFNDYVYAQQALNPVRIDEQTDVAPVQVGGRTVVFH